MGSDYLKLWEPGRPATLEHMVLGTLRNTGRAQLIFRPQPDTFSQGLSGSQTRPSKRSRIFLSLAVTSNQNMICLSSDLSQQKSACLLTTAPGPSLVSRNKCSFILGGCGYRIGHVHYVTLFGDGSRKQEEAPEMYPRKI